MATPRTETLTQRRIALAGPILAGAAALTVVMLTVRPIQAVALMYQAQGAIVENRQEQAVQLLRAAARADPLDPLPLKTAAFVRYRLGQADSARALEHFRDYVTLSRAAVQRNRLDHTFWRSLGLANMFLATGTGDFALVDEAIGDMRKALELNPRWATGWLDLARMAAVTGPQGERAALLWTALEATDKALALEDNRPREVGPALTARERTELLRMREDLLRRAKAVGAPSPAARSSR